MVLKRKGSGRKICSRKKRTIRKLEEPSRSLQALFSLIPDPAAIIDAKGDILAVNDGAEKLAGLKREELVGKNFLEMKILTAKSASTATRNLAKRMRGLPIPPHELELSTRNGEKRWGEVNSTKIEYEGKPAILAVFRETTKHKQTEEEHKQTSEFLNSILSNMSDYVWIIDEDYTIRFLNVTAKSQHGDAVGEKCYKVTRNFDSPCHHRGIPCEVHELLEKGRDYFEDTRLSPVIGRITHIRATPTTTPDGKRAVVMVSRDVTEEKQANEKLQESEQRYRTLFEEALNPILLVDKNGRYIDANKAALQFLECDLEKLRSKVVWDWAPPALLEEQKREHTPFLSRRTVETEYLVHGETKTLLLNVVPFTVSKEILYGIGQDITERKKIEKELGEEREKLEEAQRLGRIGNWEYDVESQRIVWSDEVFALYERDPALGPPTAEEEAKYYSADQAKILRDYAARAIKNGEELTYDLEAILPSGSKAFFAASMRPIKDESGRVIRLFGTVQDITERKRMEEELRENEKRYRLMFENLRSAVAVYEAIDDGRDFVIKDFSAAERIEQVKREDVIGKSVLGVFPGVKDLGLSDVFRRVWRTGEPEHHPAALYKDQRISGWRDNYVYKLPSGEVVAIYEDVTDKTRAKEQLEKAYSTLRATLESTADGILVVDNDGKITDFNQKYVKMSQIPESILSSRDDRRLVSFIKDQLKDPEGFKKRTRELFAQPDLERSDLLEFKDGRIFERYSRPQRMGGRTVGRVVSFHDITERRRAEDALRANVEFSSSLMENSPNPILVVSPDTSIQYMNPELERVTGYSSSEVVGRKPPYPWWPKESAETIAERLKKNMLGGVRRYEERFRRKNGEDCWVEINATSIMSNGAVKYYLSSWVDITERRQLEDELKRYTEHLEDLVKQRTEDLARSEELLKTTIESTPDHIFVRDRDRKFVYVNDSYCRFLGKPRDMILGRTLYDIYPKEQADSLTREDDEVFKKGLVFRRPDSTVVDANGVEIVIDVIKAPLRDAQGNVTHLVGVGRDVTERKKMEGALQDSERRYRRLVEHAPEMIFVHSEGRLVYVNPAGVKLLGATAPEQLVGKPVMNFIHPDYREIGAERIRRAYEEGIEAPPMVQKYLRLDGGDVDVETIAVPITYQGKPAVQGVARDITERKKIEQMRDSFISAVTHELRTPLVSISGYTDLALSGKFGSLSGDVKSGLEVIRRNADRLVSLADDLLDIRRIESGKLELKISSVSLKEIIDHCVAEVKPFLKEKQEFDVQVPDVLPTIQGDRVRLSQVLMNLLSNAAKFTPEGGTIKLSVKDEEGVVKVQVCDTGIGIRREDLERVFEPFAAIQKPTYIKGTGLGLSVTKGLVEAHGGRIWAESEGEGKGARFTFTLPKRKQEETSKAA